MVIIEPITITDHHLNHNHHKNTQQLGLVGCVRDLVVEGSSVALAEVDG